MLVFMESQLLKLQVVKLQLVDWQGMKLRVMRLRVVKFMRLRVMRFKAIHGSAVHEVSSHGMSSHSTSEIWIPLGGHHGLCTSPCVGVCHQGRSHFMGVVCEGELVHIAIKFQGSGVTGVSGLHRGH